MGPCLRDRVERGLLGSNWFKCAAINEGDDNKSTFAKVLLSTSPTALQYTYIYYLGTKWGLYKIHLNSCKPPRMLVLLSLRPIMKIECSYSKLVPKLIYLKVEICLNLGVTLLGGNDVLKKHFEAFPLYLPTLRPTNRCCTFH